MKPEHLLGSNLRWFRMDWARECDLDRLRVELEKIMDPEYAEGLLTPLRPRGRETVFKSIFEKRALAMGGRNVVVKRTVGDRTASGRRKVRNTPGVMIYTIPDPGAGGVDVELGIMFELKGGKCLFRKKDPVTGIWTQIAPSSDPITDGLEQEWLDELGKLKPEQVRNWLFDDVAVRCYLAVPFVGGQCLSLLPADAAEFDQVAQCVEAACGLRVLTAEQQFQLSIEGEAEKILEEMKARVTPDGPDWKPPSNRWINSAKERAQRIRDMEESWAAALSAKLESVQARAREADKLLMFAELSSSSKD